MVYNGRVKYRCKYCKEEYFDKREFAYHKRKNHLEEISHLSTSDTSSIPPSEESSPHSKITTKRKYSFVHSPSLFRDSTSPESAAGPISSESDAGASEEETGDIVSTVLEDDNTPEDVSQIQNPQPTFIPTPTENSNTVKTAGSGRPRKRPKNMPLKIGKSPRADDDGDESELFMNNPKFLGG